MLCPGGGPKRIVNYNYCDDRVKVYTQSTPTKLVSYIYVCRLGTWILGRENIIEPFEDNRAQRLTRRSKPNSELP